MKEILFLSHRIPYPPNKGDKIRSFNILKHLSRAFLVHLGTFIDDPNDWQYASHIKSICGETKFLPLTPSQRKLISLRGFITREALTLPYYWNKEMKIWVKSLINTRAICGIFVFSSAMAQYVEDVGSLRRVIDFVDVDSDKWLQYAEKKSWPLSWVYQREGTYLLEFDRRIANSFYRSIFVSKNEAHLFRKLAPECASKVIAMENGVDTVYFNGAVEYANPYPINTEVLVFTGAMDYWANVDAVEWMAREVFPEILSRHRQARFYIVGARPTPGVMALAKIAGVVVTGAVDDIRPYLAHSRLALAPLRIARGVQNKVLEAMAMGKSLIASLAAMEGIDVDRQLDLKVANSQHDWIHLISESLSGHSLPEDSHVNRNFVLERYSWVQNLKVLETLWGEK
jgi:sugar transferase (PEP-CTERM/EpsH1 system associated)